MSAVSCGCGYVNSADARFCAGCGSRLTALSGERRQLTVLFADLVGSTRLSAELDPEELRDLDDAYLGACYAVASKHDATVGEVLGDGVVIYFGYPVSAEDDARRALRCGIELIRAIGALDERLTAPVRLSVRIGIHTGIVVTASSGPDGRGEWIAHGSVAEIAGELQKEADPGFIVVSDETWNLVSDYFSAHPQPARQRNSPFQKTIWRIEGEVKLRDRLGPGPARSQIVGRLEERSILEEGWAAAQEGRSSYILLRGDPGMGKSRLARFAREKAEESGGRILLARGTPDSRNQPLHAVGPFLEAALDAGRDQPEEERLQTAESSLQALGLSAGEYLPFLAPLLGIELPDRYPAIEASPARRRLRTIEMVVRLVEAIGKQTPTLLIFEDLHWADASTAELFEQLVSTVTGASLLAVFAARPELDPTWGSGTSLHVLNLDRLDDACAGALVRSIAGSKPLPPGFQRQILKRSEGVPLYVEELTRSVLESGALLEREASWELAGHLFEDVIPTAIHPALSARIDRLGDSRPTAQVAATIGREFSFALLREISDRDETRLRRDIRRLLEAGLVWEAPEEETDAYVFKHALIRDAAYESLLRTTRQEYHARIAAALRGKLHDLAHDRHDLIAHHLSSAGMHEEAVSFWEAAGHAAMARSAMPEAAANFGQAIASLRQLPVTPASQEHEMELQGMIAPVLMAVYGWASLEVEQACERGRQLAAQLGRPDRAYFPLWGTWSVYFLRSELDRALRIAQEVEHMADATDKPWLQVTGKHTVAYTRALRAEFREAMEAADAGMALFSMDQERKIVSTLQFSSSIALLQSRAFSQWMLGQLEEADATADRMLQLGRDLEHGPVLASALAFSLHGGGIRFAHNGEIARLQPLAEELFQLSQDEGFVFWETIAETYLGVIAFANGEAGGLDRMMAGREAWLRSRTRITLVMVNVMIAEALLQVDRVESLRLLEEAEAGLNAGAEALHAPEIWRVRGRILDLDGDSRGAEASHLKAITFADRQKARTLELRAALDLYEFFSPAGRAAEGRDRLAAAFRKVSWPLQYPEPARAHEILSSPV